MTCCRSIGLRYAGEAPERQRRRLRVILTEASGIEARRERRASVPLPGAITVERAYLDLVQEEVQLILYLADTLTQAKALYTRPEAIAALRRLRAKGWQLRPHYHWGHLAKGFGGLSSTLDVDDYIDLWIDEIPRTGVVKRVDWPSYWSWLLEHHVVEPEARDKFRVDFDDTDRQSATPRPGLRLWQQWPLQQAEELDNTHGRLSGVVGQALRDATAALHETVTWGATTPD